MTLTETSSPETMDSVGGYPKRLIEVDLPIRRISAHARREKSIRHGHISTLHLWWARRPLAACRAVVCAALWPDPADPSCPEAFRVEARKQMDQWSRNQLGLLSAESWKRFLALQKDPSLAEDPEHLRLLLLDFVADFADYQNATRREFLDTARALTKSAHEALGGLPGTRPLVLDPFAGGGAIPLEAARSGADAYASDLNPVAVLLNKLVLEYMPRYGAKLSIATRKWGDWVRAQAEAELRSFYPQDQDGATPITYIWARTIRCEGPACGTEVPLVRSLWLAKKSKRSVALKMVPDREKRTVGFEISEGVKASEVGEGTIRRGSPTCPVCGYSMPVAAVRKQLKARRGGAADARLLAVVTTRTDKPGRFFRLPSARDMDAFRSAVAELERRKDAHNRPMSLVPDESTEGYHSFVNRGPIYGLSSWEHYFLARQALVLTVLTRLVREAGDQLAKQQDPEFATAVQTVLALCVDKVADLANACCRWEPVAQCPRQLFARQAIPMVWDIAEGVPIGDSSGSFGIMIDRFVHVLDQIGSDWVAGHAELASATAHPLPDDSAQAFITDPPYYYSIQYADLSDFFYVWLKRSLADKHPTLFGAPLTPKDDEIIVQSPGHEFAAEGKNNAFYEARMRVAMEEGRRVLAPAGVGVVVFAHTSTAGWEALLQAMIEAGWVITGSWPLDTEMSTRVIAQNRAVLASSIHLVCRPRENTHGFVGTTQVGDWRDILGELPRRIHNWMPRLRDEGVVGADAIFACLGPALELFSRYDRVEKASGDRVLLKEYLEHVWAAVSREALTLLFTEADTAGLEADARLTAMWLWTLSTSSSTEQAEAKDEVEEGEEEDSSSGAVAAGFSLEYDAARKIAQGLGAELPRLEHLVEVKGDVARLLAVSERTRYLFGSAGLEPTPSKRPKARLQLDLFTELAQAEEGATWGISGAPPPGTTILDRVHQAMILFAAGRSDALQRFLVEQGVGANQAFWRLAQALSALYPSGTEEKRWVDGVLARKKGLGF